MTVISNPDDVPAGGIRINLKRFMTDDEYAISILGEDYFNELLAMAEGILAEEKEKA